MGFLERITQSTTHLVADYLKALSRVDEEGDMKSLSAKVSQLREALVLDSGNGALDGILRFQMDHGDTYGLATALGKVTMDMSVVEQSLTRFVTLADSAIHTMKSSSAAFEPVLSREATVDALYVLGGLTSTVWTTVIGTSLELPLVTGRVLGSALGLFAESIDTTLNKVVSTTKTILEALLADTLNNGRDASGDSVLFVLCNINSQLESPNGGRDCTIFLFLIPALLLLPIWLPLLYALLILNAICGALSPNSRLLCEKDPNLSMCPMDALRCEQAALSSALPTI